MSLKPFECEYCHTKWVKEDKFLAHTCEPMLRARIMNTFKGKAGHALYGYWFRQKGFKAPSVATFMKSKLFYSFVHLLDFADKMKIGDIQQYIDVMITRNIDPPFWKRDDVYAYYLEYLDRRVSPIKSVTKSLKTLVALAERLDIDVSDIFDVLHPGDIMQMLQTRKLSPWLLLFSPKFKAKLAEMDSSSQQAINDFIQFDYWMTQIKYYQDDVVHIKRIMIAADL